MCPLLPGILRGRQDPPQTCWPTLSAARPETLIFLPKKKKQSNVTQLILPQPYACSCVSEDP